MRRNLISRILASVLATWLAVCLAEPVQLHTCTMHGGLSLAQTKVGGSHGLSLAAEHGATRTGVAHSHQDQSSDTESRHCTCFGACNAGSSAIGLTSTEISLVAVAITEASLTDVAYDSPRVVGPDFLLPFSNGPPTRSSRA